MFNLFVAEAKVLLEHELNPYFKLKRLIYVYGKTELAIILIEGLELIIQELKQGLVLIPLPPLH